MANDPLLGWILSAAYREGHFVLSSGATSDYYIDLRVLTLTPEPATLIADGLLDLIAPTGVVAVGGPTVSAVPILGALCVRAHQRGIPISAFFVRGTQKTHGMGQKVEGPALEEGGRVAILDDVISMGGGIRGAIEGAEEAGASVVKVLAVVDREMGGSDALRADGYDVEALYTISGIRAARARQAGGPTS